MANFKEIFRRKLRKRNAEKSEHWDIICMKIFKSNTTEHAGTDETQLGRTRQDHDILGAQQEQLYNTEELAQSELISEMNFKKLSKHLPFQTDGKKLSLIYSSFKHGYSLQTLYRRSRSWALTSDVWSETAPCILIVSDLEDNVFGAFNTYLPRIQSHRFIGTGESFLFTLEPKLNVYPWSGRNDYFMNCGKDYLAVGGSANKSTIGTEVGSFGTGLWIDNDLKYGRSMRCETYQSEILSSNEDFEIAGVELWAFGLD